MENLNYLNIVCMPPYFGNPQILGHTWYLVITIFTYFLFLQANYKVIGQFETLSRYWPFLDLRFLDLKRSVLKVSNSIYVHNTGNPIIVGYNFCVY